MRIKEMIISHPFQLFNQSNKLIRCITSLSCINKTKTKIQTQTKSLNQNIKFCNFTSHSQLNSHLNSHSHNKYFFDQELSQLHQINPHKFSIHLSNNWSITNIPNGGFLSSLAIKTSRQVIQHGNIISLSSHFYNRTIENCETEIVVEVLNSTKSSSTVLTTISQENIKRCSFFLTFSFKKSNKFTLINDSSPPNLPPINECSSASEKLRKYAGNNLRIAERVDFWIDNNSNFINNLITTSLSSSSSSSSPPSPPSSLLNENSNNKAELNCWLRFSDERPITLTSLGFLNDCLPPPILSLLGMRNTWVPTVEYSVQFWGIPIIPSNNHNNQNNNHNNNQSFDSHECVLVGQEENPWVQAQFITNHVENGMLSTDSQIWSSDGKTLLANSRQLAKLVTI